MPENRGYGCCKRRKTFCFCCSVRTGASVIGWFNFIINSLYVGMMVLSLAKIKDELSIKIDDQEQSHTSITLTSATIQTEVVSASGEGAPQEKITFERNISLSCLVNGTRFTDACICAGYGNFASANETTCQGGEKDCSQCYLGYIAKTLIPVLYKSVAIPGILLVFSIIWLTAVESRTLWYVRYAGALYIVAIFTQTIMQLAFLAFGNKHLVKKGFQPISWPVWLVFGVYAAINVYFIPILYKYIRLRKKEWSQGLEQGLLTSEPTEPIQSRPLDVYLEDAFAIDSDGEMDVFRCSIDENQHVGYGSNQATVVTTGSPPDGSNIRS